MEQLIIYFTHLRHQTDNRAIVVRYADLTSAMDRLDDSLHDVVMLYGVVGLSQRQTGKILGISQPTVGARYWRAVEKLTELINDN